MRVVVRAFTADGYQKDILSMSERQILMNDLKIKETCGAVLGGLTFGGRINPEDFPEMEYFEVLVKE